MNEEHQKLCSSAGWIEFLVDEVLVPFAGGVDLGAEALELGPGPGAATGWLVDQVKHLTCIESDTDAAEALRRRFAGRNVDVILGDATRMEFADSAFDSVCSFTMLHHVPTVRAQHLLLSESFRVLREGGVLVGSDSLASDGLHRFHEGDTYNPLEPAAFLTRLQTIGFHPITLTVGFDLRFAAYKSKPDCGESTDCDEDQ